jgi:hypothetical protein
MHLAPNIYIAQIGAHAVVMDIERDRYFSLSPSLSRVVEALLTYDMAVGNPPLWARKKLIERKIFTDIGERPPSMAFHRVAKSQRASNSVNYIFPTTIPLNISAQRALLETALSLRFRPLLSTISWLRRQKHLSTTSANGHPLQSLIDAFNVARPWFPVKPICRLDAVAMSLFLWRNGIGADLVFGARLEPFAAHCWVQYKDVVLNESSDFVTRYTPLMGV